jgi:ribosomal protein S18 acetylase RimI-like enzyme
VHPGGDAATRLCRAAADVARSAAAGGPPRAHQDVGRITATDVGVDAPWSVQALLPPDWSGPPAELDAAVAWCRERGGSRGFGVVVRAEQQAVPRGRGLQVRDVRPVFALPGSAAVDLAELAGGTVDTRPPRDDVVAAYGGWMADPALGAALVWPSDVARHDRRFLVAHAGGRPAGCALLWLVAETLYLSGIGVMAEQRGQGLGTALVRAAVAVGLETSPRPDVVWMHATEEGAALYERLGFVRVDEHVTFGP